MTDPTLKPPPDQHMATERAVLGAMMMSDDACYEALSLLDERAFASPRHRLIFRAISRAYNATDPRDPAGIEFSLKEAGVDGEVRYEYLSELLDWVIAPSMTAQHCRRLIELATLRIKRELAEQAARAYASGDTASADSALAQTVEVEARSKPRRTLALAGEELLAALPLEAQSGHVGISTGFVALDSMLNGLVRGVQMIIGAHTHKGKTTLALQMVCQAIEVGEPVLYFCLESTEQEFLRRATSIATGINAGPRCWEKWSDEDRAMFVDRVRFISRQPAVVDYTSSLDGILRVCRAMRPRPRVVVIDHIQLVSIERADGEEVVRRASKALKALSLELDCTLILLSQFHRGAAPTGEPELNYLKHSSSLEQDADTVILIGQDKGDAEKSPPEATLWLKKNRKYGRVGRVPVRVHKATGRFYEVATEEDDY